MFADTDCLVKPLIWTEGCLQLLDQRLLPHREIWVECSKVEQVVAAIRDMQIRGAPAIGIAAAYAVVLAAAQRIQEQGARWRDAMTTDLAALTAARPTAVNLSWAVQQMCHVLHEIKSADQAVAQLQAAACALHQADLEANRVMGLLGAEVIAKDSRRGREVMTHCNAGALATAGYGTALGVIRSAWQRQLIDKVHVNETRPWWQGSRLTAWELAQEGIAAQLNVDSAAAHQMKLAPISWVIVGADRITANGDVANKIGTYQLAIQALHHGVGLMVVAPTSTIDMATEFGDQIEIEDRGADELLYAAGQRIAADIQVVNPVFDVTPADLVDVLVTERGVVHRPNAAKLEKLMSRKAMH